MQQVQSKKAWRLLRIFLYLLLAFALVRVYFLATDDFRIANITNEAIPYHPEWDIPSPTSAEQAQIDAILSQNFTYLGKGAQSYAFASADGRYVLKFFKFKHIRPNWLADLIPNISPFTEYKERIAYKKARQLNGVFAGYRLAYGVNKQESGLLYIQLNPPKQPHYVTLIDKIGLKRTLDLGTVPFILQYKGVTLRNTMIDLLEKGDLALAKTRISQILNLYLSEYRKGIYDRDHGVMHNTGFVGENPIHLDVGKLSADDNMRQLNVYREDLLKVLARFELWLHINYPQYYQELIQYLETELSGIFGSPFTFPKR